MKSLLSFVLVALVCSAANTPNNFSIESNAVMSQMLLAARSVKSARFTLENTERIEKALLTGKQSVTIQVQPFKCYVKLIAPKKGAELLYVSGENDNQAIYEPNGMPYVQMKLDPKGWLLRQNNHHTIYELGFGYLSGILQHYMTSQPKAFKVLEKVNWNGNTGHRVEINFTDFGYYNYTVQKGENVESIANKKFLSKYLIIEKNKSISGFEPIKEGTVIKLPTHYAKRIELFVDERTNLPLHQKIYDDQGLFEQYIYTQVEINPEIRSSVFSVTNLGKGLL